jgi:hypothetical protein
MGSEVGPFSVASAATTVDSDPELVGRAVALVVVVQPQAPEVGARES